MRKLVIFVCAMLAASPTIAAAPALRQQMMQPPGWVFPNLPPGGLDYDFRNGRYWVKGTGYEPPYITVVRAWPETCTDAYGVLWYSPNNVACNSQNLQVWEARTNDALWSNDLTQAGTWTKTNTTAALNATGPDNIANSASTITASAGNGTILQAITLANQADTYSVYVKCVICTGTISIAEYPSGTPAFTALTSSNCFNPAGIGTAPNTSSWVRCNAEATILNPVIGFQITNSSDSIRVFCNQLEPGTFPSPCIPTTSGTAARAADAIKLTATPVFGSAYSLVAWGTPAAPTSYAVTQPILSFDNGTLTQRAQLYRGATATDDVTLVGNGALNGTISTSTTWAQNSTGKIALAFAPGSHREAFNGILSAQDTSGGSISGTEVAVGRRADGITQFDGIISRIAIWPTTALSASGLQQVTQ